jgi:hypothetical protein
MRHSFQVFRVDTVPIAAEMVNFRARWRFAIAVNIGPDVRPALPATAHLQAIPLGAWLVPARDALVPPDLGVLRSLLRLRGLVYGARGGVSSPGVHLPCGRVILP